MFSESKGFTLLEVLLSLSILSLIFTMISVMMIYSYKIWWEEDNFMANRQKGEVALQKLTDQLRRAKNIDLISAGKCIVFRCYYHNQDMKWLKYGLYKKDGISILGLKTADCEGEAVDYSNYMPVINNVVKFKIKKSGSDKPIYEIGLVLTDSSGNREKFIRRVSAGET